MAYIELRKICKEYRKRELKVPVLTDLDFYMQVYSNRSHYNSDVFFSDPSQYLYYHIVFDEFAYHMLRNPPATSS